MKYNPVISIIVPVYNAEDYLADCINSILRQTYIYFELLLINDGSRDKSGKICDCFAEQDDRIRVIHKKNEGVSIARNVGIEIARGEWICFVDSDDWVESDYLAAFVELSPKRFDFLSQGILLDFEHTPEKNKYFFQYPDIVFHVSDTDLLLKYDILQNGCPYGKLYNKSLLDDFQIRFETQISTNEDHLFVWTYLQFVKYCRLISRVTYHYMQRNNQSLSRRFHSSEELILVSDLLCSRLNILLSLWHIEINQYVKEVYSRYGISQLFMAVRNSNYMNYRDVLLYFCSRLPLIKQFYITKEKFPKILLFCIRLKFPLIFVFFIIRLQQKRYS